MDDTQEWINFLYNRAENLEKSLPRPERYLTPPLVVVIFGGLASIVGWLGGWLGSLGVWWEKLLGSILIAIIIVIVCIAGGLYGYWVWYGLLYKKKIISTKKKNVLMLIAMILGKRVIGPEDIYNNWQKCDKSESFEEQKEIENAFKIKSSPENVSLEDVKRGFKQLDEVSQEKYMKYLFGRKNHIEEIEEWLTKNHGELSKRVSSSMVWKR